MPLLVLPEPIIQIPAVQQHFIALGLSRDFDSGAVQNKGKKKRAQRVPCWTPDADIN